MPDRTKVSAKKPETKKTNIVFQARKTERSQSMSSPASRILFFFRKLSVIRQCSDCSNPGRSGKLRIGQPNDKYEQEADREWPIRSCGCQNRVQRQSKRKREKRRFNQTTY